MNPFEYNLADFAMGHESDPLRPPADFTAWKVASARYQRLYERTAACAPAVRTTLSVEGHRYDVVNLASLDYLGLSRHPDVVAAQQDALREWGTGACGVPMLSGMTEVHRALEREVADLVGRESAMLFTSGFSGAIGLMSAVLRRRDVAVTDEHAHISMMDGARMTGARLVTFTHDDPAALDAALQKTEGCRRLVVVDGLYSMDGDTADLPALLHVTEQHGVGLVVDEAHSIFALGSQGGGVTEMTGSGNRVRLLFGTFSKALGAVGAFVAGDRALLDYIRMYAHPYVFSAALPPAIAAGTLAAVRIAREASAQRTRLAENATYFRRALAGMGVDTGRSTTHVVPIVLGANRAHLYEACHTLMERGLYLPPVDFPAVPEDRLRFRASISAGHTREDLDRALELIEDVVIRPLRRTL